MSNSTFNTLQLANNTRINPLTEEALIALTKELGEVSPAENVTLSASVKAPSGNLFNGLPLGNIKASPEELLEAKIKTLGNILDKPKFFTAKAPHLVADLLKLNA